MEKCITRVLQLQRKLPLLYSENVQEFDFNEAPQIIHI